MLRVDGFQLHSISIVDDAVQDGFCQRAVLTAELVEPFSVIVLRAEDGGCMASTFVDELCNLTAFLFIRRDQQSLVDDEKLGVGVLLQYLAVGILLTSQGNICEVVRQADDSASTSAAKRSSKDCAS